MPGIESHEAESINPAEAAMDSLMPQQADQLGTGNKPEVSQNSPLTDEEIQEKSQGFPEVTDLTPEDRDDIAWAKEYFESKKGHPMATRDVSSVADEDGTYAVLVKDADRFRFFKKS